MNIHLLSSKMTQRRIISKDVVLQSIEQQAFMLDVLRFMSEKMQKCDIRALKTGRLIPIISIRNVPLLKKVDQLNGSAEISVQELQCSIHVPYLSEMIRGPFITG